MEERVTNFGKKEIIGSATLKIDNKNRIVLPSFTYATPEDKIALMYDLKRTKIIIEEWKKFEEHIDYIDDMLKKMYQDKKLTHKQLHQMQLYVFGDGCLEPPTTVGNGRRIVIPSRAIEKLNLKDEVFAVGNTVKIEAQDKELILHRLEIYPSEESYTLSKKNV